MRNLAAGARGMAATEKAVEVQQTTTSNRDSEGQQVAGESLSHRAEVFRSKLIEGFQILDCVTEEGREKAPVYNSSDATMPHILEKLLMEAPQQVVNFKVYKRDQEEGVAGMDRRLTRIKNQNYLPLGVWAKWVVENDLFQKFLMALIVINSVSIGVQGELPLSDHPGMVVLREFLNFIDAFTVIVFSVEILLKWMDNFSVFWRDSWNVFDLIVTVLSAVPLVVEPFIGSRGSGVVIVEQLAVFRILRALKMVARFGRLRIIVLTILKAIKSMVFITILLFAVAYIFAIVGVVFFESYSIPDRPDLSYHHSFSSLPRALLTLFQLFTLDQWFQIHADLVEVSSQAFTSTYILLWVWVGAFLFRNLFVGIMVNNFQTITADLFRRQECAEQSQELARMKEELDNEINKHDTRMHRPPLFPSLELVQEKTRQGGVEEGEVEGEVEGVEEGEVEGEVEGEESHDSSRVLQEEERVSEGWDRTVHSHLMALAASPVETLWPKDSLFRYLEAMEQLQENLEESEKLLDLTNDCLLEMVDTQASSLH